MIKPCKSFKCTDAETCERCYNGICTGNGYNGYTHCGCDYCEHQRILGPFIGCSVKDKANTEDIYDDWDDDYDFIKYP